MLEKIDGELGLPVNYSRQTIADKRMLITPCPNAVLAGF